MQLQKPLQQVNFTGNLEREVKETSLDFIGNSESIVNEFRKFILALVYINSIEQGEHKIISWTD